MRPASRLALLALAGACLLAPPHGLASDRAAGPAADAHRGHHGAMTDAEMQRQIDAWYAGHPRVGGGATALGIDATFTASGTRFDADGSSGTAVDTVRIDVGQTVLWQWVSGAHTVTSGSGPSDPGAGLVFDQPLTSANPQFLHTFDGAGTFPFFCSPHAGFGMRGVVVVEEVVGVSPLPGGRGIGFTADPWPNPTTAGVSFRFALAVDGRVRADVIDARGRFVATIVDRVHPAGTHGATWDGRGPTGRAPAGVYTLRLLVPGFAGGRNFVLAR